MEDSLAAMSRESPSDKHGKSSKPSVTSRASHGPKGDVDSFEELTASAAQARTEMVQKVLFRGLRPEAGNAGSRGDLSHILLEVLETLLKLRSAHVRPARARARARPPPLLEGAATIYSFFDFLQLAFPPRVPSM